MSTFLNRIIEGVHDMCYIWMKEMKATVQDEGVLIFFILVPLLYPLLYSWAYNNEVVRDVPVAVVDLSHTQLSRQFIRQYDASPDVKVAYHCNSLEEARELVGKQIIRGVVYIPADFAQKLNRMEQSHISVYCDMSYMLAYKAIFQTATAVSGGMNKDIQIDLSGNYTSREDDISTQPLAVEEVAIFNPTGGYGTFILPGVLMLILQQTLVLGIGLSAGTARERNRYHELIPIDRHYQGIFRIIGGKTLCYFMIYAVMGAYLTLVVPRLFSFVSLAHWQDLLAMMVPYILACIFFGIIVSCIVRYRENVMLLMVFISVPLLFLTGVSWPQSNIPAFWQSISWLFPSTFGVRAYVRMNTMGATLNDVALEYCLLWVQTVFYCIVASLVYRHQIVISRRNALVRLDRIGRKLAVTEQLRRRKKK